jgi:osmotically-inducible protein OsmY
MARKVWTLVLALGVALSAAGCDDTWRGVKKDTKENTDAAKQTAHETGLDKAAEKAAEKAEEAAVAAKRGLEKVARDVTDGRDQPKAPAVAPAPDGTAENDVERSVGKAQAKLEETGRELTEGARGVGAHVNVKQALMRDNTVDSSNIDVDIDNDTRTVLLRGTVPTAPQKGAAERIARAHANGYQVRNELVVAVR